MEKTNAEFELGSSVLISLQKSVVLKLCCGRKYSGRGMIEKQDLETVSKNLMPKNMISKSEILLITCNS